MFEYQKYNSYFAQCAGKMEKYAEEELKQFGAQKTNQKYRGIYFSADKKNLYKIIYQSRLITKVFAPLVTFSCHSTKYLKKTIAKLKWDNFLDLDKTFSVSSSVSNSKIKHSKYAALCVKDVIVDYFRDKTGKRPDVDTSSPDISFDVHIENNRAVVSVNLSGESLHKRGYRLNSGESPMQETLAAMLVKLSRWKGEKSLWDLTCGSGTILSEAVMSYSNIPAQFLRNDFGFFYLPDYDKNIWRNVKNDAEKKMCNLPKGLIKGSDISKTAIANAKQNLSRLPNGDNVELQALSFQNADSFENGIVISNPPYGIRTGTKNEIEKLYMDIGDFLKNRCKGTHAYIYIGDKSMVKYFRLKPDHRYPLVNGAIEGELLHFKIY